MTEEVNMPSEYRTCVFVNSKAPHNLISANIQLFDANTQIDVQILPKFINLELSA